MPAQSGIYMPYKIHLALSTTTMPTLCQGVICQKLFDDIQDSLHRLNHLLPAQHERGGHFTRKSVTQRI